MSSRRVFLVVDLPTDELQEDLENFLDDNSLVPVALMWAENPKEKK